MYISILHFKIHEFCTNISFYEFRINSVVGLPCEFIHSCKNDCVLFRGKVEKLVHCPKCGEPWYRQNLQGASTPQKVNINYPCIKA
jgi:hypothetical protein